MAIEVVVGAPFSGKDRWIAREIERREAAGEVGLIALSFSALYGGMFPGDESVYRDQRAGDSGAPRLTGFLLAVALREAVERQIDGYLAVDSPRRAIDALAQAGTRQVVEVVVSQPIAIDRAGMHVDLVRTLAPRAGGSADSGSPDATARCLKMVRTYFSERHVLDSVPVRKVTSPDRPSDQAVQYAWRAAIRARKRGDEPTAVRWVLAAEAMLAKRGVITRGIR